MKSEFLIGFDAREVWLDNSILWSSNRKKVLLLKDSVIKPLSVGNSVWQSVFDTESVQQFSEENPDLNIPWENVPVLPQYQSKKWAQIFSTKPNLSVPDYMGPRSIWQNLDELTKYIDIVWGKQWKPTWIIAITELADNSDSQVIGQYQSYSIKPDVIQSNWKLLGYDVADYFFNASISNAGYKLEERNELSFKWNQSLNKYHLFDNRDNALSFLNVAHQRGEEHRPFSVYGLYLVEAKNT